MLHFDEFGLLAGAIALGAVHGIEPGHGWPVAASYALDRANKWFYGFAASLVIGIGHLISSIAMVGAFFYAKSYFSLTRINEPITIVGSVQVGGPVSLVAGVLLITLGAREYVHGRPYGHSRGPHGHQHERDEEHEHPHDHSHGGLFARFEGRIPFVDEDAHAEDNLDEAAERGLLGIAWFAFVLGFAHEEEFEIIALCVGSAYCLELMMAYALTVIVSIVVLTVLFIAGYHHFEERVERYTPYLPLFSAAVLTIMGLGFITGIF